MKEKNKHTLYVDMSKNTKSLKLFICQLSMDQSSWKPFKILNHCEKYRTLLYESSYTNLYDKTMENINLPTKMELEFTKNEKTNH